MPTRVAIIGTGPNPDEPDWGTSAAMAYRHAAGYDQIDTVEIAGCADIVEEHARAFADEFGIADEHVYTDYPEMIDAVEPDVVSVCTPVHTHADIVIDCATTGVVQAIHCEKPMAHTWEASRQMAEECDRRGVQLTFNHQRRYGVQTREIKAMLEDGVIGPLCRMEFATKNIFDAGSHFFELCGCFNRDRPAEWVMGQIDYREENVRYGVHNENQAVVHWQYDNGVFGTAVTGFDGYLDCTVRLLGEDGILEVGPPGDAQFRVKQHEGSWEEFEMDGPMADIAASVRSVVRYVETGEPSELRAENALNSTEIIFGAYESSRRRGRVDLPLDISDNPLVAMVEAGDLDVDDAADE